MYSLGINSARVVGNAAVVLDALDAAGRIRSELLSGDHIALIVKEPVRVACPCSGAYAKCIIGDRRHFFRDGCHN